MLGACLAAGLAALIAATMTAGAVSGALTLKTNPAAKRAHKHHRPHGIAQCNLKTEEQPDEREVGDSQDFSVKLLLLSTRKVRGEPATLAVQVTVHKPHILICSATIIVAVAPPTPGPWQNHEFHVKIGPHGGRSSSITTPDKVVFEIAEVRGRKG
jgi:hypothetical protein